MTKIKNLQKQLEEIKSELLDTDRFRDTPALRKFKRVLNGELSTVKDELNKIIENLQAITLEQIKVIMQLVEQIQKTIFDLPSSFSENL